MSTRPWRRLAAVRARRRLEREIPPPGPETQSRPVPALEPPDDDDRELVPFPQLRVGADPAAA